MLERGISLKMMRERKQGGREGVSRLAGGFRARDLRALGGHVGGGKGRRKRALLIKKWRKKNRNALWITRERQP